tara:strand:+ start:112739 stop:117706 length:4968 start_codon:yes stop_codon:yes gene_type:complete
MQKKKSNYRFLRRTLRLIAVLFLLIFALLLFIRSPWGQSIIVAKATGFVAKKTGAKVEIKKLFITFSGNAFIEGLYLEDKKGDTLVYSKSLEANIPIAPLVFKNNITVKSLQWDGLQANITRNDGSEDYNFSFLIDAFASTDTTTRDTTAQSEPLKIDVGTLDFTNFKIDFRDELGGLFAKLDLGYVLLSLDKIDLEAMAFEVDEILLENTNINYRQTKPSISEDATATTLPCIQLHHLKFKNVKANYQAEPNGISAKINLDEFQLKLPKADIATNDYNASFVSLKNSSITLKQRTLKVVDSTSDTSTSVFEWPMFLINVDEIDFENNRIYYVTNENSIKKNEFNPENLKFDNFYLKAQNLSYEPKKANVKLQKLSFGEQSGFQLQNLSLNASLNNTSASITELNAQTNNSILNGNLKLSYGSIQNLMKNVDKTSIKTQLTNFEINLNDALYFQPQLKKNANFITASNNNIAGNLKAEGTLQQLNIADFNLIWGENTSISARGILNNFTDTEKLQFNFNKIEARTTSTAISKFIPQDSLSISMPSALSLSATARGKLDDITADAFLKTSEGSVTISGNFKNSTSIAFQGNLAVDSLQLGKILNNEQLGLVDFTLDFDGNGNSLNTLNGNLKADFEQLNYNDYDFSNLKLNGTIVNGTGEVNVNFKDENLNLTSKTSINLDALGTDIKLNMNLIGADFLRLGITKEDIKIAVELDAKVKTNEDGFKLDAQIFNGVAVYDNQQYRLSTIDISSKINDFTTEARIESDFLKGNLSANASPSALNKALIKQFKNYFSDSIPQISETDSIRLNLNLRVLPDPIITKVFFKEIKELDSIYVQADFNAETKKINAKLKLPAAIYQGVALDSLALDLVGDAENLKFSAGFEKIHVAPVFIKKTLVTGVLEQKKLQLNFNAYNEEQIVASISSQATFKNDSLKFYINPSNLVLNTEKWMLPETNEISIINGGFNFKDFKLNRETQEIFIGNTIDGIQKKHLGVDFTNFKLQSLLSILNPDEALVSGIVNGTFILEDNNGASGIIADFNISDFAALQNPLGNLAINASSSSGNNYDFDLALKDAGINLNLNGDYAAAETGASLNLDLNINRVELKAIEKFSNGMIKNTEGFLSGNIDVSGTTSAPEYQGLVKFNETKFNIAALNSIFKITDESLKINNKGLYFDTFSIADVNNNTFSLTGSIETENQTNPTFDIQFKAEQFQVLNSTIEDNALFYGKASFDADISVKGNLKLPKVAGKLRVRKITDVTYVIPESQLDVQERDGVVIFVNRENPDNILTRNDEQEKLPFFRGFDVKTILEIADDAKFNVIIDEKTGDNLAVSGDASLNLSVEPNGRVNLSGRYELNSGHYETNLYNLVSRRFEINPGSTITWQGNPQDAKLDVTAVYKVETSASPLMSSVTSGQDISQTRKYQQVLPFVVYLNVDGELLEPQLSFGLDMPRDEQGALGGAVYGRVQQLNQQEDELNRQVFSLLALNRFFPDSGSDGSSGGTTAIARDNVNRVLSDQLNVFSSEILGNSGFDLDFDLDSFTDYQGENPQDRTQLNINAKQKLFNDRLIVSAGSAVDVEGSAQAGQEATPIIGNVSLEYLLTKDGRYRLRGFRKNEYENIIDGQLIVTGVALIFNREFNKFSQLFNPLKDKNNKDTDK